MKRESTHDEERDGTARAGLDVDEAEACFREAYERARTERALDVPLLIVLADQIVLHGSGERQSRTYVPDEFRAIQAASHLVVAAFLLLSEPADDVRTERLARAIDAALGGEGLPDDPALRERLMDLLRHGASALGGRGATASGSREIAESLARATRQPLFALFEDAAALALAGLHRAVEVVLADCSRESRAKLRVLVAGNHQARRRSLPMQYFQRRIGDQRGREGEEPRVVYGENVATEAEALALLGTLRADRVLAGAFFGDPARMDRDLLGDAATRSLDAMKLVPLETS